MSDDTSASDKKLDADIQTVADITFYEDYDWEAYRVAKDKDGLYLMTDCGCSCYSPFEYCYGLCWREFNNKAGEQFMDYATGPLTSFQAVGELMSLLDCSHFADLDNDVDRKEIESAVCAILDANINTTSHTEEKETA